MTSKLTRSNRTGLVLGLLAISCACAGQAQTGSAAQAGKSAPMPVPTVRQEVFQAEMERDTRLAVPVTLAAPSTTLQQCLEELTKSSGVHLTTADAIRTRRVSAFAAKLPLHDLMTALARVFGFSWRIATPAAGHASTAATNAANAANPAAAVTVSQAAAPVGYELYPSNETRLIERAAMRASEEREQRDLKAKSDATLAALNASLAAQSKDKPSFADMLGDLSASQLQRLADRAAPDDVDVLIAANNSYMHDHLLFARPFSSLKPATQQSLLAQLSQPRADSRGPLPPYPDLSGRQVGFVAMNGDVRLAIVNADGRDLNTTHLDAHRQGLRGIDTNDGSSAEVNQAVDDNMVSLNGLAGAKREKRLRFAGILQRNSLAAVLESVARQTGISIVSDDYFSSRFTPYDWLLTDRDEYTLPQALDQIARAFAHRIRYEDGVLRVTTVTPGLDLRGEPPDEAITHMRKIAARKLPMTLDDYLLLGGLTRLQCRMMPAAVAYGETQAAVQTNMQQLYPVLHLVSLLSAAQRRQAEQAGGLRSADLRAQARQAFDMLTDRGLPALLTAADAPAQSGLYMRHKYMRHKKIGEHADEVQFLIVSDSAPTNVIVYRLRLP